MRYLERANMDKIISLSKRRGFMFQSSEIYGGLNATWDYGPLGVELKRNVKEAWWRSVVQERDDMVGLDAAILMHPQVWVASGHVDSFSDPLVECKSCHLRFRADKIDVFKIYGGGLGSEVLEESSFLGYVTDVDYDGVELSAKAEGATQTLHTKHGFSGYKRQWAGDLKHLSDKSIADISQIPCPSCSGELTDPRQFNLMFKTFMGPVEDTAHEVYLRPETAQGIFVNFANVVVASRRKLPFGIAQMGKAFRNEITPGNTTFRTREFEQMEIEYFVKPGEGQGWLDSWVEERLAWYVKYGIRRENLRLRRHGEDELAHYARDCYDIEYNFPWGWAELEGIADRTDYDLRSHGEASGQDLTYFDDETKERYYPYVIEPSGGVDRAALAFLLDAYDEEPDKDDTRVVLRFHRHMAPAKVAVLPLSRNQKLVPTAREVHALVRRHLPTQYDDAQSIGRRYRRQDEIGTPYCVTVDFETLDDKQVTIRDRDTMHQIRVPVAELVSILKDKLEHGW